MTQTSGKEGTATESLKKKNKEIRMVPLNGWQLDLKSRGVLTDRSSILPPSAILGEGNESNVGC